VFRVAFHEHDTMPGRQLPAQFVRRNDTSDAAAEDHNRF
jgi:hypothetical protein